jgi:hypothetical protein
MKNIFGLLIYGLIAVGCSTVGPKKPPIANEEVLLQYSYELKKTTSNSSKKYFRFAYENAMDREKTRVRNEIVYELRSLINFNYNNYEVALRDDMSGKDLAANISAVGMSAAASAVGGDTARILSAITAGVVAANSQVNETLFKNQSMEALRFEMRRLRTQQDTILLLSLSEEDNVYPLSKALGDLIELYNRGFITRALDSLVMQSAASLNKIQVDNERAKLDPAGELTKVKSSATSLNK